MYPAYRQNIRTPDNIADRKVFSRIRAFTSNRREFRIIDSRLQAYRGTCVIIFVLICTG